MDSSVATQVMIRIRQRVCCAQRSRSQITRCCICASVRVLITPAACCDPHAKQPYSMQTINPSHLALSWVSCCMSGCSRLLSAKVPSSLFVEFVTCGAEAVGVTRPFCLRAVPVVLSNPPVVRYDNGPATPRAPACFANNTASAATVALFLNASASNYGPAPGAIDVSTIATTPIELVGLHNTTVCARPLWLQHRDDARLRKYAQTIAPEVLVRCCTSDYACHYECQETWAWGFRCGGCLSTGPASAAGLVAKFGRLRAARPCILNAASDFPDPLLLCRAIPFTWPPSRGRCRTPPPAAWPSPSPSPPAATSRLRPPRPPRRRRR